jgi:PAS domain S-box-containing protein
MTGTYDLRLVALSVVIAMFASFVALDLAGRITASRYKARLFWLLGGACAMGFGIWSMHYVGMLAFRMPMRTLYDLPTVALSLLAAIAASVVALFTVSRRRMGLWQNVTGGMVMGAGVAGMHYIGMAAMRMPARITYNRPLVLTSIALAVITSIIALRLAFRIRDECRTSLRKITSALIMGSAIPLMHYTGMWAASFSASDAPVDVSHSISISSLGIAVISFSSILILSLIIVGAFLDRLVSSQKDLTEEARSELRRNMHALLESEERLRVVTENARVGLATVNPDRRYVYVNRAYAELLDLPSSAIVGQRVADVLSGVYEEQIRPQLDRAFGGERVAYELCIPAKDGDRYCEARYEPTTVTGTVPAVVVVVTDLTERNKAEAAFRRLAAIVEFSDDAIIGKDLNGIITSWNSGAKKIFGYTASEMLGTSIIRLIPAERQGEEDHILGQIRSGKSVHHFETLRQTKDGRLIDVSVTASPINDVSGRPIGVSKVARDITERKRAEAVVNKSEGQFRLLVEEAMDAFFLHDSSGKFLEVNRRACESLGYSKAELLTMGVSDVSSLSQEEVKSVWDQLQSGLTLTVNDRQRRKDGTTFPVEVRLGSFAVEERHLFLGLARDVTEREQAQEQIAEQAALLEKARDAILVRDLEGKILFWNNGAERIYGWTRQEVLGRNIGELLYSNSKDFEELNGLAIGQGEWYGEVMHLTRDKREITVEGRWTLIRDNEGRPKSILAINTDITDKKKIEAQFMRAQRLESLGNLAGGIAHDLNNILAPILLSIDFLKSVSDHPQAKKILETIDVSARRGADIVRQVLSFARGMEGKRIDVQPKHLLKDLQSIIKDSFPKNIQLQFLIPNDLWTVLGDPTQVLQILLNLCVNARDAMPDGGSLIVRVENHVLDEQYAAMNIEAKAGRYVSISVADSGTGIPRNLLDRIFEPFFTTKELNKGTGLGLSTVMAVVNSHGGFVTVDSELGKGTTFRVFLPAIEASSVAGKQRLEKASLPRGNDETILVIDDEDSILTVTSQTLQAFGYRVLTATNGADGLAVYVQHKNEIAVVLTDMMMPVMDGAATIRALLRINPAVKIIASSGLRTNGGEAKTSGIGIKCFLTKPYTAGALLDSMRAILDEDEKPVNIVPAML